MQVLLWQYGPEGTPSEVARLPLRDGQPVTGDRVDIVTGNATILFRVIERQWKVEANPNGGGVTVVLRAQVTQIGAVPHDVSSNDDSGPGDDGGAGSRSSRSA